MSTGTLPLASPRVLRATLCAGALALLAAAPAGAQDGYRISERGTITQKVGRTKLSLDYSRPIARGRSDLFGKVVVWGELWTPGANEATVFETDQPVKLNGHPVPAGRWSMWIIPSRVGEWELVLDPRDSLFHTQRPELKNDQVRFPLETRMDAPHTEVLAWTFPRVRHDGATMQLNWGSTEIAIDVGVASIRPKAEITASEAEPFIGEWEVAFVPDPKTGKTQPPFTFTVARNEKGMLTARIPPGVFAPPPDTTVSPDEAKLSPQERERAEAKRELAKLEQGEFRYILVPRAKGVFLMGYADDDGELLEAYEFFHEFEFENGRAVRVTMRDDKDEVQARGKRVQK